MNPEKYQLFGTGHLLSIAVICIIGILIIYAGKNLNKSAQKKLAVFLSLALILPEIPDLLFRTFVLFDPVKENLPLHMCGVSLYITALALIYGNKYLYELSYFWGTGGAVAAILSPGDIFYFPHILNIIFYSSHGLIIIGALYMTIVQKYRPVLMSLVRVCLVNVVYMAAVYGINLLIDTNYLFLRYKPKGDTLFNHMGPWPVYIFVTLAMGVASYILLYTPFLVNDIYKKYFRRGHMG